MKEGACYDFRDCHILLTGSAFRRQLIQRRTTGTIAVQATASGESTGRNFLKTTISIAQNMLSRIHTRAFLCLHVLLAGLAIAPQSLSEPRTDFVMYM